MRHAVRLIGLIRAAALVDWLIEAVDVNAKNKGFGHHRVSQSAKRRRDSQNTTPDHPCSHHVPICQNQVAPFSKACWMNTAGFK